MNVVINDNSIFKDGSCPESILKAKKAKIPLYCIKSRPYLRPKEIEKVFCKGATIHQIHQFPPFSWRQMVKMKISCLWKDGKRIWEMKQFVCWAVLKNVNKIVSVKGQSLFSAVLWIEFAVHVGIENVSREFLYESDILSIFNIEVFTV